MSEFPTLYTTTAVNEAGLTGQAYFPDGLTVAVASPLQPTPGTNTVQLLGAALSTCLQATMEANE